MLRAAESDRVDEAAEGLLTLKGKKRTGLGAKSVISVTWSP